MVSWQDIRIKICGLTRPDDVGAAIFFGADYLGFIIEAESPRRLSVAQARKLTRPAQDVLPCVAVTVNPSKALINDIADSPSFTHIQLHGSAVTHQDMNWINTNTDLSVIRSIAMRDPSNMSDIEQAAKFADGILLDAPPPRGGTQEGGHGSVFDWTQVDWDRINKINAQTAVGLAGGLYPKNVAQAKMMTGLSFFDVSSGVEARAGVKDPSKIAAFIKAAKQG